MQKAGYTFFWDDSTGTAECFATINDTDYHLFSLSILEATGTGPVSAERLEMEGADRTPWCLFLMNGKTRTVELDIEGEDADRHDIARKAVIKYKDMGYGEGIPW